MIRTSGNEQQAVCGLPKLPKLRVESPILGYPKETYDFGQVKHCLRFDCGILVILDGKWVSSYDELIRLATQDNYRNKEFLDIKVMPLVGGG